MSGVVRLTCAACRRTRVQHFRFGSRTWVDAAARWSAVTEGWRFADGRQLCPQCLGVEPGKRLKELSEDACANPLRVG